MATHQIAKGIAQLGRNGDSTLVHMQPHEVAGLQALAESQGTSLTINPETGLPEAFSLDEFFKSLLPVLAGAATGGAGAPLWAGIAAGSATGALTNRKNPLQGAIMGGMGGYGGFNLGQGFAGAGAGATTPAAGGVQLGGATPVPTGAGIQFGSSAANQIPSGALDQALSQSAVNFDPIARQTAENIVSNTGPGVAFKNTVSQATLPGDIGYLGQGISGKEIMNSGAVGSASPGGAYSAQQGLQNMGQGIQNVATGQEGAWDAFKQGLAGAGKPAVSNLSAAGSLAMPLGGAVLSGLEPTDIYGEPIKPDDRDKYDPYATLNLSGDTGLRLYAQGGPISFADGGDSNKDPAGLPGGGLGSLQGAGMMPIDVSDINTKYGVKDAIIPAPKLGLFADNDQIESARTGYEQQLASAMSGRGGMGVSDTSLPYNMVRGMGGLQNPNGGENGMGAYAARSIGMGGLQNPPIGMGGNSMADYAARSIGTTAPTAATAETALSRLNLNKNYAIGGTIQSGGIRDLYGTQDDPTTGPALSRDGYGLGRLQQLADGGVPSYAEGGYLDGPGDGMSDSIHATIEGKQPARLADGEFVIPADVVSHLGNGSTKAGSQRLYAMLDKVRKARTGTKKQGKQINPAKYMPA